MTGRELEDCLNYVGMERGVRNLALKKGLMPAEDLAVATVLEVCEKVLEFYNVVYTESEEIGFVRKEDIKKLNDLLEIVSR